MFKQIQKSIYGPEYYQELVAKPFSFSLKYYVKFSLLLGVLAMLVLTAVYYPQVRGFIGEGVGSIIDHYPADLEVTLTKGEVSINAAEPYLVPLPQDVAEESADESPANLLVIDTVTPFSIEQYYEYNTVAWLTKDSLAVLDNGKIQLVPLTDIPDTVINREVISGWVAQVRPYLSWGALVILPIAFFFAAIFAQIGRMLYLLFGALLIWALSGIMKWKLSYGKAYQVGLHAVTLPTLLFGLLSWLGIWDAFLLVPSLVLLGVVWFNLRTAQPTLSVPATTPPASPTPPTRPQTIA